MSANSISTSTTSRSDEPLRQAVRNVYAAMTADFGRQFRKQFDRVADPFAISENVWMRRLFDRIGNSEPGDVVDGYERCISERSPQMPNLVEISDAIRAVRNQRLLAAEQIMWASAPRVNGLSGIVDHLARNADGEIADESIALMREILKRPAPKNEDERNARLDKSITAHESMLESAPKRMNRSARKYCSVAGCGKDGRFTMSTFSIDDKTPWFCIEHWNAA